MSEITHLCKVLSIPPSYSWNVCAAFCFIFPSNFGGGQELGKSGSVDCMKVICLMSPSIKRSRTSSLPLPASFPWSCYHLPDASARWLLAPGLCHLLLLLCPTCVLPLTSQGLACIHDFSHFLSLAFNSFPCPYLVIPACLLHTAPKRILS